VNLPLRIVRLLGGEQNPNSKPGAFQGSRSISKLHKAYHSADEAIRGFAPWAVNPVAIELDLVDLRTPRYFSMEDVST